MMFSQKKIDISNFVIPDAYYEEDDIQ